MVKIPAATSGLHITSRDLLPNLVSHAITTLTCHSLLAIRHGNGKHLRRAVNLITELVCFLRNRLSGYTFLQIQKDLLSVHLNIDAYIHVCTVRYSYLYLYIHRHPYDV